jgi:two-component system sensor histidine kinase/response regulator
LIAPRGSFGFQGASGCIAILGGAMRAAPLRHLRKPEQAGEALADGYEVCEQLKSHGELADVPVIFLRALNEIQDKVKAFRSGGVDYISKPFQFEEVHARVETHLKLHHLQRALKLHNERLEEAVAARTRELAEVNGRLTILDRSKNEFLRLISHEFRTPLHGLLGVGELILSEMPSSEQNIELQCLFRRCRRRILSILDDAMLLTHIDVSGEEFRSAPVSLHSALKRAIE